jgi:hypothetical protein
MRVPSKQASHVCPSSRKSSLQDAVSLRSLSSSRTSKKRKPKCVTQVVIRQDKNQITSLHPLLHCSIIKIHLAQLQCEIDLRILTLPLPNARTTTNPFIPPPLTDPRLKMRRLGEILVNFRDALYHFRAVEVDYSSRHTY